MKLGEEKFDQSTYRRRYRDMDIYGVYRGDSKSNKQVPPVMILKKRSFRQTNQGNTICLRIM